MLENITEKLLGMPRMYLYIFTAYFVFLLVDIFYFFMPSASYGLYADMYVFGFTLYSFVPLAIFAAELAGKIGDEHFGFVRDVNYLLMIFFILVTAVLIAPILVL